MRWLLAGCCGLALINLSVAQSIFQRPRFYGVKTGSTIKIGCSQIPNLQTPVEWYKADMYNRPVEKRERLVDQNDKILLISEGRIEDSGVYFCKMNNTWGPGSEVRVVKRINVAKALYRSKMKDGLIIFQGLLLAVCIAAILLRKQRLLEKNDSLYEEPETDHIYEGLAIETCGGGLYEELSVYAQAEGAEAPWE
ncbi:B-cell antigen receptor complex-associated protein beta chain [Trachinotus anak]|uniref:B-cell antigen receptor complex-associated protein beta chain n=1 Tax=Trachinotus anak TaxID=443729 RepID=UPI0039F246E2